MIDPRKVVAALLELGKLPDLERRLALVELDQSDFDRDLGRVEAIVRQHHIGTPEVARRAR